MPEGSEREKIVPIKPRATNVNMLLHGSKPSALSVGTVNVSINKESSGTIVLSYDAKMSVAGGAPVTLSTTVTMESSGTILCNRTLYDANGTSKDHKSSEFHEPKIVTTFNILYNELLANDRAKKLSGALNDEQIDALIGSINRVVNHKTPSPAYMGR